ncbi:MAG TPA: hypothetical protein VN456_08610, partial [Desulfosporosinus sp.]|nr:hypothetical protein [Desulfosporosinus sp.]
MDSSKLGLSIFDVLGYLLPGYIVVFSISMAEATFFKSSFFTLSALGANIFLFSIIAYFLGIICHGLATLTKDKFYKMFSSKKNKLPNLIYSCVSQAISETYNIKPNGDERLHTLENYLLADSYILASGCDEERMALMVREGFYKTSMFAILFLFLVSSLSLFAGGIQIQAEAGKIVGIGFFQTLIISGIFFGFFLLFRNRFIFYN